MPVSIFTLEKVRRREGSSWSVMARVSCDKDPEAEGKVIDYLISKCEPHPDWFWVIGKWTQRDTFGVATFYDCDYFYDSRNQ